MSTRSRLLAVGVSALLSGSLAWAAGQNEQHFVKEAIQGNLAEVDVGNLAQQKGASQGVKDFGAMLAKDHAAANEKAEQAAATLGVTSPSQPSAKQKALYKKLSALSGEQFDRQFIKSMVKDHEEDIAKYEKESNSGTGAAAEYAKAILPDLHKHLETAQHLQQQERTASASSHHSKG
jgi:putative membrane protein